MAVDQDKLMQLLGTFVGDLGATMHAGSVVIGHKLGLYEALAEGPASPSELATRAGCHPRYVTEWLRGQAAGGYVHVDPETETYSLSEEARPAATASSAAARTATGIETESLRMRVPRTRRRCVWAALPDVFVANRPPWRMVRSIIRPI